MIKNHIPESKKPARTTFALTEIEVAQALVDYVKSQGETVPNGNWNVWVRDNPVRDMAFATLVIDQKD